jgi:hypothetical protein
MRSMTISRSGSVAGVSLSPMTLTGHDGAGMSESGRVLRRCLMLAAQRVRFTSGPIAQSPVRFAGSVNGAGLRPVVVVVPRGRFIAHPSSCCCRAADCGWDLAVWWVKPDSERRPRRARQSVPQDRREVGTDSTYLDGSALIAPCPGRAEDRRCRGTTRLGAAPAAPSAP